MTVVWIENKCAKRSCPRWWDPYRQFVTSMSQAKWKIPLLSGRFGYFYNSILFRFFTLALTSLYSCCASVKKLMFMRWPWNGPNGDHIVSILSHCWEGRPLFHRTFSTQWIRSRFLCEKVELVQVSLFNYTCIWIWIETFFERKKKQE